MRVLVLVEGQSEERFVKDVLAPHLQKFGVFPVPKIIVTKVVRAGANFKGGISTYAQFARDLRLLLGDSGAAKITTIIDLYHLPPSFPNFAEAMGQPNYSNKVAVLCDGLKRDFPDARFEPYFSVHEYEALTLIESGPFLSLVPGPIRVDELRRLCLYDNPETIDLDDPPAKRILSVAENYSKYLHGSAIIQRHGLDAIRKRCPSFDAWLKKLEDL